jgi:hypothetical protein
LKPVILRVAEVIGGVRLKPKSKTTDMRIESADPKYVEVYRARNVPQAHAIRMALEEAGIRVLIEGEFLQSAAGDILGWDIAPRILVEESQLTSAREIIEKAEVQAAAEADQEEENDEAIRCFSCGAVMPIGEAKCRSCGWSYQSEGSPAEKESSLAGVSKDDSAAAIIPKPSTSPPQFTRRELWFEVLVVLSVGIFPHIKNAFLLAFVSPGRWPFWLYCVDSLFQSAFISFVVLYLIYRSGEPWSAFGIKRPFLGDIGLGLLIFVTNGFVLWFFSAFPMPDFENVDHSARPEKASNYLLLLIRIAASAFTQELVTRAYLITRLEQLFRSQAKAVIVSSAWFASYHLYYGLGGLIYMMILGLAFGTLYLMIRRIWPFAIGHMIWNIFAALRVPT